MSPPPLTHVQRKEALYKPRAEKYITGRQKRHAQPRRPGKPISLLACTNVVPVILDVLARSILLRVINIEAIKCLIAGRQRLAEPYDRCC